MTSEERGTSRPARIYGPYHRLKSETQTYELALEQESSRELWGRTPRGSNWPQVKAYRGPLPPGEEGIEFDTTARPDGRDVEEGMHVRWSGPPQGNNPVRGDFVIIECVIRLISYRRTTP